MENRSEQNNKIERRYFQSELRAKPESRSVGGYAAVYSKESNSLGWFKEIIAPDAFKRVLETSSDVVALFNHDTNYVLGRQSANTLKVWADENGLGWDVPSIPASREDVLEAISRGDVSKCSFSFSLGPDMEKWHEDENGTLIRTITDFAAIYDVGPVTFPAYSDTSVAKRSAQEYLKKEEKTTIELFEKQLQLMEHFL